MNMTEEEQKQLASLVEKAAEKGVKHASHTNQIRMVLVTAAVCAAAVFAAGRISLFPKNPETSRVEDHDLTLDNHGPFGYKAADFEDAVLGAAKQQQLLIVDEQEVSVPTTITQAGLFSWDVFTKVQNETIYGTGQYTIDLGKVTASSISLDEDTFTLTIAIPRAELHQVTFDPAKTVIGDTEKGWLAFGEIQLTAEQTKAFETEATEKLTQRLREQDCFEQADRFALLSAWETYQPLVSQVSPAYKVNIVFQN